MRKIAIIGAGQAGLLLACALKKNNYQVTLFSNRTSEQIRNGSITSSQVTFGSALQIERKLEMDFWEKHCPQNLSVTFALRAPNSLEKLIEWKGLTAKPFQSVDQRLKFSNWLEKFQNMDGQVVIQDIQLDDLKSITEEHELTITASGKGDIGQAFLRDNQRSTLSKPARALACMYVKGMTPDPKHPGVRGNIIPGVGEYFTTPGLSLNGNCEMMLFEGIPGGAFDVWERSMTPDEILKKGISLLNQHVPWEAEKCEALQLADPKATLVGSFTPIVRHPVLKLSDNRLVFGLGDTVVLNDPVAGQGANNAIRATEIYLNNIIKQGEKPFDENWMKETFEQYWNQHAEAATKWTNLLLSPPPAHIINLLVAAANSTAIAEILANGFDDPNTLFPWITQPEQIERLIQEKAHT